MAQRLFRPLVPIHLARSSLLSVANIRASPTAFASASASASLGWLSGLRTTRKGERNNNSAAGAVDYTGTKKGGSDAEWQTVGRVGENCCEVEYEDTRRGLRQEGWDVCGGGRGNNAVLEGRVVRRFFCVQRGRGGDGDNPGARWWGCETEVPGVTQRDNETKPDDGEGGGKRNKCTMSHLSAGTFNAAGNFDEHRRRNSVGQSAVSKFVPPPPGRSSSVVGTPATEACELEVAHGGGLAPRLVGGALSGPLYQAFSKISLVPLGRGRRSATISAAAAGPGVRAAFGAETGTGVLRHYYSTTSTAAAGSRLGDSGYGESQSDAPRKVLGTGLSHYRHGHAANATSQGMTQIVQEPAASQHGSVHQQASGVTALAQRRRASTSVMGYPGQPAPIPPRTTALTTVTVKHNNAISTEVGPQFLLPTSPDVGARLLESTTPVDRIHEVDHYMRVPITELVRAYTILRACTMLGGVAGILETATHLFRRFAPSLMQELLYGAAVKPTFFQHFCGGVSVKDVFEASRPQLAQNGLGIILEYSVECDIGGETRMADQVADGVRDEIVQGIRACRADLRMRKEQVEKRGRMTNVLATKLAEAMVAIKISALCPPSVLYRVSEAINALKASFTEISKNRHGHVTIQDLRMNTPWFQWFESECRRLTKQGLAANAPTARLMPVETTPMYMLSLFNNAQRKVDWLDLERILTSFLVHLPPSHAVANVPAPFNNVTSEDKIAWHKLQARLSKICIDASEEVPLLVDAEQTYFNPAIALATTQMSYIYNRRYPTLWTTQQLYLKSGVSDIEQYIEKAKREAWIPALKLVRGAYMVSERQRARNLGIPDPIHDTLADTHHAYKTALQFLLVNQSADPYVLVASHNQDSVNYVSGLMRHGMSLSNRVAFAQLKGMCDSMGVDLARQGYTALKWVPYGPVRDAVPYLVRRVQENATLLDSPAAHADLAQMKAALAARLGLFQAPVRG